MFMCTIGHRDDGISLDKGNHGNFQVLLQFRVEAGDEVLKHFSSAPQHATYRFKTMNNKIIQCCSKDIHYHITQGVRESKLFSMLADEAEDSSHKKQLSTALRYMDNRM